MQQRRFVVKEETDIHPHAVKVVKHRDTGLLFRIENGELFGFKIEDGNIVDDQIEHAPAVESAPEVGFGQTDQDLILLRLSGVDPLKVDEIVGAFTAELKVFSLAVDLVVPVIGASDFFRFGNGGKKIAGSQKS